jgi:hypothetical protein
MLDDPLPALIPKRPAPPPAKGLAQEHRIRLLYAASDTKVEFCLSLESTITTCESQH